MSNGESFRMTCVSTIKNLDNLLKCGICYEYLKTALITPCSHNYCSYCIRKSLMYKTQCPSCFEETTEPQLRNNRVLDEFVLGFSTIKDTVLRCVANTQYVRRNMFENLSDNTESKEETTNTTLADDRQPSLPPVEGNRPTNPPSTSSSETNNTSSDTRMLSSPIKEVRIPSIFSPRKQKVTNIDVPKVMCPVCSVEIPERNINIHLDACLKRSQEKCLPRNERRKPLPKLVYTLFKEKELRKKLSDLGLSSLGDRNTLINRHKRYTLLYNSECDTLNPRAVSEIVKQLKKEEEEEKKTVTNCAPVMKLNVDRKADPKTNEEAQRQYLQEHKSSFQKLIESIQKNKQIKKAQKNEMDVDNSDVICLDEMFAEREAEVISVDGTSASSEPYEVEPLIRSVPKSKRKRIVSESEESSEEIPNGSALDGKLKVEASVHNSVEKGSSKPAKIKGRKSRKNSKSSKLLGGNETVTSVGSNEGVTLLTDMADHISSDTRSPMCSDINTDVHNTSETSGSSPVLGRRSKIDSTSLITPKKRIGNREITPDMFEEDSEVKKEEINYYSETSNESVSLMVYQGPDSQSTPVKSQSRYSSPVYERKLNENCSPSPVHERKLDKNCSPSPVHERKLDENCSPSPVYERKLDENCSPSPVYERKCDENCSSSPVFKSKPGLLKEQMTFSLGIDSILPETEDFVKTPKRRGRSSRTLGKSADVEPSSRTLRKRSKN